MDPGDRIGRYELDRLIGRSAHSTVWLARDPALGRQVAVKGLTVSAPAVMKPALDEWRIGGALAHPNVVTVLDQLEHDGAPWFVMEYVAGGSLRTWVGRVGLAQFARVMEGALAALESAAARGIVHRDLKPENLLVTGDGRIKVADFGIAAVVGSVQEDGLAIGTPEYMAPEQAMAQEIGPTADLYSLGCVAFELLAGRLPFPGHGGWEAVLSRHVNEPAPWLSDVTPATAPWTAAWVSRLLSKDPGDRPPSATAAWDTLEDVVIGLCGPRWRREASLPAPLGQPWGGPVTPVPWPASAIAAGSTPTPPPAPDLRADTGASGAWISRTPPPREPVPTPTPAPVIRVPTPHEDFPTPPSHAAEPVPTPAPAGERYETFAPGLPPLAAEAPPAPTPAGEDFETFSRGLPPVAAEAPAARQSTPPQTRPSRLHPSEPESADSPMQAAERSRGGGLLRKALQALGRASRGRSSAPAAEPTALIRRTPHIDAPSYLTPGQLFDAVVFLDHAGPRPGEETEDILVRLPAREDEITLDVWLVATHHFALNDAPVKRLRVKIGDHRSEAVSFRLAVQAASEPGKDAVISAAFSHNGRPGGRVSLSLAVAASPGGAAPPLSAPAAEAALEVDARAMPPDLTVEIASVEHDGRRFNVRISTPLMALERSTESWWLPGESAAIVEATMRRFFEPQASRAARRASLQGAGIEFYDAAPALFKEVFWRLHDTGRPPRNLYLVSDEVSIPWELMIPHRRTADGGVETRKPLGVELAVGRWHRRTGVSPRQRVPLRNSYVLAPRYTGSQALATAELEAEMVCRRFDGRRIEPARFEHLDQVLSDGGADLLHFVCHGEADRGGVQVLLLEDFDELDAQQVRAMAGLTAACRSHKPLVFLNACEVGRPAPGLVGPSGFARSFIDVDASGVVGTLWSVDDRTAHEVAVRFYGALGDDDGTPFAEVLRSIRNSAYAEDGEDTYAAYCYYGDPAAHAA